MRRRISQFVLFTTINVSSQLVRNTFSSATNCQPSSYCSPLNQRVGTTKSGSHGLQLSVFVLCFFWGGGGIAQLLWSRSGPHWTCSSVLHIASNDAAWAVHCSTEWSTVLFQDLIWVSSGLLGSLLADMWPCLWLRSGGHVPSFHIHNLG